jgi:leucyl aminopeptidase (aminopeptidase T)
MDIKKGIAENIEGPDEVVELLMRAKCGRTVCEIGIGMNPRARISGNMLEDQKAKGTVHLGFGDNTTFGGEIHCDMHNDGMLTNPTLDVDGITVIENGRFALDI